MGLDIATSLRRAATTGVERRVARGELRTEILAVLREAGEDGVSYTDLVSRVLTQHLQLGPEPPRAVERSDVENIVDTVSDILGVLPQQPGPWGPALGPVLRTEQVRALLGTTRPVSRQALADRAARRTLLALRTSDRHTVYPAWQFRSRRVLPGVPEVLQAFVVDKHPVVDPWTLASWLRTPLDALDGDSVVHRLADGEIDPAVEVARTAAARWAR